MMLTVVLIMVGGTTHVVPFSQFRVADPDICFFVHLHASLLNPVQDVVTALSGATVPDPDKDGCGYDEYFNVVISTIPDLPDDMDRDGIPDSEDAFPNDPDVDDDGVPDGDRDTEGDGLSDSFETTVTMTDPEDPFSSDPLFDDGEVFFMEQLANRYTFITLATGAFPGAGLTTQDVLDVVGNANSLLAGLNIRLVTNSPNLNLDDGNNDGVIDAAERGPLEYALGAWTVNMFGRGIYAGYAAPNYSPSFSNPMGYVRFPGINIFQRSDASNPELGAGLAHFLAHLLGLQDSAGVDPVDVMQAPSALYSRVQQQGIGSVSFLPEHRVKLGKKNFETFLDRQFHVDPVTHAVSERQRQGVVGFDDVGDNMGSPAYTDLAGFALDSDASSFGIQWVLTKYGQLPDMAISTSDRIQFDWDANTATGFTNPFGVQGIDFELEIRYDRPGTGQPVDVSAVAHYNDTFTTTPAVAPVKVPVHYRADTAVTPVGDGASGALQKNELNITANQFPVQVVSFDENGIARDQLGMVVNLFDLQNEPVMGIGNYGYPLGTGRGESPGAQAQGPPPGAPYDPGEVVAVVISGLQASTAFDLLVDETVVLQDSTDGSGGYSGSFTVPPSTSPGNHFLTAQHANGIFAPSILVVPEPGAAALGLAALATLAWLRRVRRCPAGGRCR